MGYNFGVGRQAPTFTITAADGSEIDLKQYRGDWFVVLAFVPTRSTDAAAAVLTALSESAEDLWGRRAQLLAICDASAGDVKALAASAGQPSFPLLPDDGTVARAYGALKKDGGLRPMTFIVDRAGKIVWTGEGPEALVPAALAGALRQVAR